MASPHDEKDKQLAYNEQPPVLRTTSGDEEDDSIDLNNNTKARISNPLAKLSKAQLLDDAENFARAKGLEDEVDLIKRGALLAQNPAGFEHIDELSTEEKAAIDNEIKHKWSHPLTLYLTIFLCSIGAATQGWDQTGSNGANLS